MVAYASSHPTEQTLRDFGNGKLDDGFVEAINRHLEACANCQRRVAEMASDSFLGRLRAAHAPLGAAGMAAESPRATASLSLELTDHPDYRIVRELGRGGMGVVYLVHNQLMGRDEVLKVVSRQMMERDSVPERFLREIRAAAMLHHPNIVTAYSAFRAGEGLVFAMEYVDGLDLARLVKSKGHLPLPHACNFIHQAALGLQHAHEQGMVHRDIKPSNLMLSRPGGRPVVKVLDFGLAKASREIPVRASLTHEGQMLGTPDFIAPEQIRDAQSADIRADIYSLGCTFYYLLTGGPPFQAANLYDLLQAHFSMDAGAVDLLRPEVPPELAALVARMMAKEPDQRFQTPGEVARALVPFFRTPQSVKPAAPATVDEANQRTSEERWASLVELRSTERPDEPLATETATAESDAGGMRRRPPPSRWRMLAAAAAFALLSVIIVIIIRSDKKPTATAVVAHSSDVPPIPIKYAPAHDEDLPAERPPWLETIVGRLPEPAVTVREAAARKLLEEIKQRSDSKKDNRTALSRALLDEAREPAILPDERYARLTLAARLAAEDGAFGPAMDAYNDLGRWFDVNVLDLRAELLNTHARFADSALKYDDLACASLATGFEALGADHYRFAGTLVRLASTAAEKSGVVALVDEAALLAEDLARGQSAYATVRPHIEALRKHPNDPAASAAVGQYLCLAKNDYARGLPMLALGNQLALRAVAEAELRLLAKPANAGQADRIALGDAWWSVAEKVDQPRDRCRLHARHWYLAALAEDGSPLEASTIARVRSRLRSIPAREYQVRVRVRHVDFHGLRLDASGVKSTDNYGGMPAITFDHATWDTAKVPGLASTGATRLLPDDIDYTTAEIKDARVSGGEWPTYGRVRAFAREDHSQIAFSHWPSGGFDVEFTLAFGRSVSGKDLATEPEWDTRFFIWDQNSDWNAPGFWDSLFASKPIVTTKTRRFNYDDRSQGFAAGVPGDYFAVEATCEVELPAGDLRIKLTADDGVEFSVDGRTVVSQWKAGRHLESAVVPLTEGRHKLRLRYFQITTDAALVLRLMML